jgi:hypothetical protein
MCWFSTRFYPIFFAPDETFFAQPGFHTQANTRLAALRQASRLFPETGKPKGRREDLARLPSFFFFVNSVLTPRRPRGLFFAS